MVSSSNNNNNNNNNNNKGHSHGKFESCLSKIKKKLKYVKGVSQVLYFWKNVCLVLNTMINFDVLMSISP